VMNTLSLSHPLATLHILYATFLIYSTALRLYRIASEHDEFTKAKLEYTEHLKARGYSIDVIGEANYRGRVKR